MAQCSVSMTLAHVVEYGERKWVDICENQFSQLSAGNLNLNLSSPDPCKIRLKLRNGYIEKLERRASLQA